MPLAYLFDENLRGMLWQHVRRHNMLRVNELDVVRVGDADDLPLGSEDPDILRRAERENRILLSRDEHTMPKHLADHLAAGRRSPGVFLVRTAPLVEIVEFLVCAAYASDPVEWENRVSFMP